MKNDPSDIDIDTLKRSETTITSDIRKLTRILSKELNLKIFGFDLIQPLNDDRFYLVDLNDFPGFKGIKNVEIVLANYILDYIRSL
jgi:glutathione synthase/RimK-type ligase-like ATP-grasp enzyme